MEAPTEETKTPLDLSAVFRDGQMVKVEAGEERVIFHLHKMLLIHFSEYFKKALSGPWAEAEDGAIELDDVEPGTFSIFVEWAYTQQLPEEDSYWIKKGGKGYAEISNKCETDRRKVAKLIRLKTYVLSDRLLAIGFRRAINNAYVDQYYSSVPYYDTVIYAFEHIPPGRPILDLLVDTQVAIWDQSDDRVIEGEVELRKKLPMDFLLKVMLRYNEVKGEEEESELEPCVYHEHSSAWEKEKCQMNHSSDKGGNNEN